jgi:hypothetical protein
VGEFFIYLLYSHTRHYDVIMSYIENDMTPYDVE